MTNLPPHPQRGKLASKILKGFAIVVIVVVLPTLLSGCESLGKKKKEQNPLSPTTQTTPKSKEDFRPMVSAAVDGDDDALRKVLLWSTEIEGKEAVGCSRMLLKLRTTVGPERFAQSLKSLNQSDRLSVREKLQLALALSMSETNSYDNGQSSHQNVQRENDPLYANTSGTDLFNSQNIMGEYAAEPQPLGQPTTQNPPQNLNPNQSQILDY